MGILSSILGGVVGLGQGVLNWFAQDSVNKTNEKIARENLEYQREANAKNEALTREQWLRDDTAISRRVADLTANGLSKTLAAGNAAANSVPIAVKPLDNSYKQENNPMDILTALQMSQSFARGNQEIENMKAQKAYIESQKSAVNQDVVNKKETFDLLKQQKIKQYLENIDLYTNLVNLGTSHPDKYGKILKLLGNWLNIGTTPNNVMTDGLNMSLGLSRGGIYRHYLGIPRREGANMYDVNNSPRWDLNKIKNPSKPKIRGSYYRVGIHNEPLNYTRF